MKKKTNTLIIIAVIAMLLLAAISTGLSAYQSFGMSRGFSPGSGQFPDGLPEGMPDQKDYPSGGDMSTPPSFQGNPPDSSDQTTPFGREGSGQRDDMNGFLDGRPGGATFGVLRYIGLGLNALGLVLVVVLAIILLKGKKWAGILSLIWAGVMLLVSGYGLLTSRMLLTTVARIVCILLAIGIFVLLLLKKSRAIWCAPKPLAQEDDDDDDDDEIVAVQIPAISQPSTSETEPEQPMTSVQELPQENQDADSDDDDD